MDNFICFIFSLWIQYLKYDTGILDFTSNFENVKKQKYIVVESYPGVLFNRTDERQRIDFERKTFIRTCFLFVVGAEV